MQGHDQEWFAAAARSQLAGVLPARSEELNVTKPIQHVAAVRALAESVMDMQLNRCAKFRYTTTEPKLNSKLLTSSLIKYYPV